MRSVIRTVKRAKPARLLVLFAVKNNFRFRAPFHGTFLCKGVRAENQERTTTNQNEMKVMNNKFDELAKGLAQSVTRRGALKKFRGGLAAIALATLGLANKAKAGVCSAWGSIGQYATPTSGD